MRKRLDRALCAVLLTNALFLLFLIVKPTSKAGIVAIDNIVCTGMVVVAGIWSLAESFRAWRNPQVPRRLVRSVFLFSLGVSSFAIGESFWTYFEMVLKRPTPFPSLADAGYVLTYPFMIAAILSFPTPRMSSVSRLRAVIDGLVVVASLWTVSWYFVLGPTVLKAAESLLAKVLGVAYPAGDLLLLFLLFVLSCRVDATKGLRVGESAEAGSSGWAFVGNGSAIKCLYFGLIAFVIADTAFCYLTLRGTYETGSVFDVGWSVGQLLVACAVRMFIRSALAAKEPAESPAPSQPATPTSTDRYGLHGKGGLHETLFRLIMPYTAVVLSWILLWYAQGSSEGRPLVRGVFLGAAIIACFVLARQILALVENVRLNERLRRTNEELDASHVELGARHDELEAQQVILIEQQDLLIGQRQLLMNSNQELERAKQSLETANKKLEQQATTDGLTGLTNHRSFQERLSEEFERVQRYGGELSLLLLDVDKFKQYNDRFGHPAGDEVLRAVGKILASTARTSDIAARYGGEEFAIILPATGKQDALRAGERIRAAIEGATWSERPITVSVGVATLCAEIPSRPELVSESDRALYASKESGRNRVTHASDIVKPNEFACGNTFPYTEVLRNLLAKQDEELTNAAEHVRSVLMDGYDRTIESMAKLLDMRDKETEGHTERVTTLTVRLARFVGMNEEEVSFARWGALLHDIGKMSIPDAILHKPGSLTDAEWDVMRSHPSIAYDMLSPIAFLAPAMSIPHCHHEKWDGTGYPQQLAGDDIPLPARLFAVVDVWDALTNDRPYRSAVPTEEARAYLLEQSGTHFDPRAVRAFLAMLDGEGVKRAGGKTEITDQDEETKSQALAA